MSCVIFGAGKIARGFIGHLLYLSGIPFVFVEKNDGLADLINERGEYNINILGAPEKNTLIKNARALKFQDNIAIAEAVADADVVFTAVGGKNLQEIAPFIAAGIQKKSEKSDGGVLNIITCENWKQPARVLREEIVKCLSVNDEENSPLSLRRHPPSSNRGARKTAPSKTPILVEGGVNEVDGGSYFDFMQNVGVSESVVMRSAIEPDEESLKRDPLIVNVQNYWDLPVDASGIAGKLPDITGVNLISGFTGFLERKFYTYNAANGTAAYVGALLGYEKIADAAHDKRILEILAGVYGETSRALSLKHNFPLDEQLAFTETSLNKLQDYTIIDFIERNARDPIRKLGPDDRLVGSARLVLEYGVIPENLALSIAAAVYYTNPGDPFAAELERMRKCEGTDYILANVCRTDPQGELGLLVKEKIGELKRRGWINE